MSAETIRQLNDTFRTTGAGGGGRFLITPGVQALGAEAADQVLQAVMTFDNFTDDNDPHSEHDFGSFEHGEHTIFWKIDYYDLSLQYGSENPADPSLTTRVLTVMVSSEY